MSGAPGAPAPPIEVHPEDSAATRNGMVVSLSPGQLAVLEALVAADHGALGGDESLQHGPLPG